MDTRTVRILLLSDFNMGVFSALLHHDGDAPCVTAQAAPFGQILQTILDEKATLWGQAFDAAVVWSRPEAVSEDYADAREGKPFSPDRIREQVDAFCAAIRILQGRIPTVILPTWSAPYDAQHSGLMGMHAETGLSLTLMRMNMRLSENFKDGRGIFILDAHRWIHAGGGEAFDPRLWYMGKIPFGQPVFQQAVADIKSALRGLRGMSRKLVIVDLDDTLWGGIVGDLGWPQLRLGGHDPIGEAFADFQRGLKALTRRGIVLGIVSKNTEEIALAAVDQHPEMILRRGDFAGWRINWEDKAQNVAALVSALNLGLQSAVFIDDNPRERSRVREAFPEVFVPDWPADPMLYRKTLDGLGCFNMPHVSEEDLHRAQMYAHEQQREGLRTSAPSFEVWLKTLALTVSVERLDAENLRRAAQLLNKTNQMNLRTRRLTEAELLRWSEHPRRRIWAFRVSDKFGDLGLTGIASVECGDAEAEVSDFILSCRAMGRKVEETMLHYLVRAVRPMGIRRLNAVYRPTEKNKPCLEFLDRSGLAAGEEENQYYWTLNQDYPLPDGIHLEDRTHLRS